MSRREGNWETWVYCFLFSEWWSEEIIQGTHNTTGVKQGGKMEWMWPHYYRWIASTASGHVTCSWTHPEFYFSLINIGGGFSGFEIFGVRQNIILGEDSLKSGILMSIKPYIWHVRLRIYSENSYPDVKVMRRPCHDCRCLSGIAGWIDIQSSLRVYS